MRLRDHTAIVSKFDAFRVDPRKLRTTDGYNVRDYSTEQAQEALLTLKESIREEGGVIVPLEVRLVGDELHVVSGHRRLRAVLELIDEGVEIESVPCVGESRAVNDAERVLRLVTHNAGEPLSMLEKAEVVRRLLNMGWTREKIAARMGYKHPTSVANFELLLAAPEKIRQAVRDNEIAPSTAVELVRQHGDEAADKLVDIKTAAEKRGRSRGSIRDIAPRSEPSAIQMEVERVEAAIEILFDLSRREVSPQIVARAFGSSDDHTRVRALNWLNAFCVAIHKRNVA